MTRHRTHPPSPGPPLVFLATPPLPLLVPDEVFDGFGWCKSDELAWGHPDRWDAATPIDGTNPARMVFVMHTECAFLPRELARLHAFGLGLTNEWALAPYGIDDATDQLYDRRVRPRDVLWLAADNLNALVWGLHDWAHFHNHGPFEQRAFTELQCDAAALVWLWINREIVGLSEPTWLQVHREIIHISRGRFESEGLAFEPERVAPERLRALVPGT